MNLNKRAIMATFAIILVASLASLAFHLNLAASSTVITVSPGSSIQAAINAAHDGDTISVTAGLYNENITVDKSVNLVGADQATTIINGSGYNPRPMALVLVEANYVNISGFTIQNNGGGLSTLVTISLGNPAGGIALSGSVGCTISNSTIQDCSVGVAIGNGSGNNTVSDNSISTGNYSFTMYFGVASIANPISIVGGNTITDNNISSGASWVGIQVNTPNNEIAGNQLNNSYIQLGGNSSGGNIVSNNRISAGLTLNGASDNNVISNNTISAGLTLNGCSNNTLRDNNVSSFDVEGSELSDFMQDIDTSNTVKGRPIYYLVNQSNPPDKPMQINPSTYPDIGYLGLVNSSYVSLWGLTITNSSQGLMLAQTTNSRVDEVYLSKDTEGIYLWNSSLNHIMGSAITSSGTAIDMNLCNNNTINGNTISGNSVGVYLAGSGNNTFYRNNFIANSQHVYLADQLYNEWDDGNVTGGAYSYGFPPVHLEARPVGNYWDNYTGQDAGTQNPGLINYAGDGIGDTLLPANGVDNYPLMKPYTPIPGDLDYNGVVGLSDLVILQQHYGQHDP